MRKASAANSPKIFEMSSLGIQILRVRGCGKYFIINKDGSWIFYFIFPSVKIKTCLQIEGDVMRRQLQATLLITKHRLICGNRGYGDKPET